MTECLLGSVRRLCDFWPFGLQQRAACRTGSTLEMSRAVLFHAATSCAVRLCSAFHRPQPECHIA